MARKTQKAIARAQRAASSVAHQATDALTAARVALAACRKAEGIAAHASDPMAAIFVAHAHAASAVRAARDARRGADLKRSAAAVLREAEAALSWTTTLLSQMF